MGEDLTAERIIATTGATGAVGGRVAARLARLGLPQRLIVRDLNRAPELPKSSAALAAYEDPAAFGRAVRGADVLFLVAADRAEERTELLRAVVDAAVAEGVRHIVYLSFLNAHASATCPLGREHHATEDYLRTVGAAYTFLRPSLYLDLLPGWIGEDGTIRGPAGDGRVAWVSRDDVADVAAAVLREPERHVNRVYDVTGPEAVSLGWTATRLSTLTGRTVVYVPQTPEEAAGYLHSRGLTAREVAERVGACAAVAAGELDAVSFTVPRLTGHPARSLEGYLRKHPSALSHAPLFGNSGKAVTAP
ncbi:SDR family oxidoreductase [Thermobifida cellulosilytica]|uniref:Nucleoside-diphosphate sugar epimerase n=1 Tax=Thermobifida cellulosilytica TB100 TaxID=665004 RepID=A0A147KEJ2_THECS|nr:SDR family oxidoreductase [Thermobifida cellulosilytica]KUP95703.1 nucleoside-diphosphate sugar epimerase [Thermobifida cellulosilytica TB100]